LTLTRERAGGSGSPQPLVEGGGGGVDPGLGSGDGVGDGVAWGATGAKIGVGVGLVPGWAVGVTATGSGVGAGAVGDSSWREPQAPARRLEIRIAAPRELFVRRSRATRDTLTRWPSRCQGSP
jgi:hypothetical protein